MSDQPPPPPPPPPGGGYPPPPPGGGYPPPPPPPGGGYPPPPPPGGGYPPPPGGGYAPPPPPPGGGYAPPPQQQAGYPPVPGGYPPPQQAGYPAPGGYPPPAGPGYPGAQAFNVGEAFSWAWNKFSKNAAALIVPTLVYGGHHRNHWIGVVYGLAFALATGDDSDRVLRLQLQLSRRASASRASWCSIVGYIILMVVAAAIQSAYPGRHTGHRQRAAGDDRVVLQAAKRRQRHHREPDHRHRGGHPFRFCFIGGIVVSLFTLFATVIIVDRNTSPD